MKTLILSFLSLLSFLSVAAGPRPPVRVWHGFSGPAYLGQLPRRPSQRFLDSLANAARVRQAKLAAR